MAFAKYRIAVHNAISPRGLERFPRELYEVGKAISEPAAILLRSHVLQESEVPPSVMAIGRAGTGVNNIPVDAMSRRGIPVFNAPGANANAVKELVLAAILAASRNIVPAAAYVQSLAPGPDFERRVEEGKKQFAGHELPGRTLGVVGLGAIGGLVADTAIKLGMKVVGFDPEITAKILKRGYRIYEVPISYTGREYNEGKKISWRDGLTVMWTLLKYRLTE